MRLKSSKSVIAALPIAALFSFFDPVAVIQTGTPAPETDARVLRPATPVSVAGVARRSTRRVARRTVWRTSVYIASLPMGCTTVYIDNIELYACGSTYYQYDGDQYVVVEVQ